MANALVDAVQNPGRSRGEMHAGEAVESIMTRPVVSISMDVELQRARELMEQRHVHHLPVVHRGKLVGIVSDRDVLRAISPFADKLAERAQDAETLHAKVHQVMSRKLVTAKPSQTIQDAAALMLDAGVSCLPIVTAEGALVGIVTLRDLTRLLVGRTGR
jgi:acetoin utilization protein AcuB